MNLILQTSLIQMKSMTIRTLRWLASSTVRMLFDNSRFNEMNDSFWLILSTIWRFWRNSSQNVYKNWRISKMLERSLNDLMYLIRQSLWSFRDSSWCRRDWLSFLKILFQWCETRIYLRRLECLCHDLASLHTNSTH
jgi:hypothetical protein